MGLNHLFLGLTIFVSLCLVTKMSGTASRPPNIPTITLSHYSVKNWTHEKFQVAEQLKQPRAIQKCNTKDHISNTTSETVVEEGCLANQSSRFYDYGCSNDDLQSVFEGTAPALNL